MFDKGKIGIFLQSLLIAIYINKIFEITKIEKFLNFSMIIYDK